MTRVLRTSITLVQSPKRILGRCGDILFSGPGKPVDAPTQCAANVEEPQPTPEPDAGAALAELRDVLSSITDAVAESEAARRQSIDELQQLAIELSTAIAGELLFRSIDANEHNVVALVAAAVDKLGLDAPLSIALHPADLELVQSLASDSDVEQGWRISDLTLQPDSTLCRGECRATNGTTTVLSEITPRMEEIRRLLWEGLDHAQIERRQAAQHHSSLKRFPDRRETA